MKIYIASGFGPDLTSGNHGSQIISECFTSEDAALRCLDATVKQIASFLEDECANGTLLRYDIERKRTYHTNQRLASVKLVATYDPDKSHGIAQAMTFSALTLAYDKYDCEKLAQAMAVNFGSPEASSYTLAEINIDIKEFKVS